MSFKGVVVLLTVTILAISYGVYQVSVVKSSKTITSYYEGQQKAIDDINRFLEKK